jgi:hypothetical protein
MRRLMPILLAVLAAVSGLPASGARAGALDYLEALKGKATPYLAPSDIDPRYTIALYVNASGKGPNRQRMWVLHRDGIGGAWRLAMWDKDYWKKAKLGDGEAPGYSWPVSTGRYYPGDRKSGPTPLGVYSLDERKRRHGRGWMSDGMIHVMFIDFHYSDGRRSGVAFHGTTAGRYRRLGSIDSHGCIRMHQRNALALLDRVTGKDGVLPETERWGEVPRFWAAEKGLRRMGYTRDGRPPELPVLPAPASTPDANSGSAPAGTAGPDGAAAAPAASVPAEAGSGHPTKTGFRAIAVIFDDPG